MDKLKIAYIGGGSKFVVTLLHGLAEYRHILRQRKIALELALYDPFPERCTTNVRYAEVVARSTGLPLTAITCRTLPKAIRDCHWVIFSPGLQAEQNKFCRRFHLREKPYRLDAGPDLAITALACWPQLCRAARLAQRHAPRALFSILVNPTDVLAGAVHERFGLNTAGICVEVGGLVGFLAYYLGVREDTIQLEHIGSNHCGWVTRWRVGGRDGTPMLKRACPGLRSRPDWHPNADWFLEVFEMSGHMRTSPYHAWPFRPPANPHHARRVTKWMTHCLPGFRSKEEMRSAGLQQALQAGIMIPPFDPRRVHPEATPYWYPNARYTLGALAAGLAGGSCGPVPLQVRNGNVNPAFPPEAFLEVPVRIETGRLRPQTVPVPEKWMMETMAVESKRLFMKWLAGGREEWLMESIMATGGLFDVEAMREVLQISWKRARDIS